MIGAGTLIKAVVKHEVRRTAETKVAVKAARVQAAVDNHKRGRL